MALPGRPPSTDECESRSRDGRGRMLRVEYKGQPYDWFNLDDMGDLIHSEDFASTLKENINHYFEVGFDDQAVFDEDGLLVSPADYLRSLRHPRPYFRVFSLRQMPPDLKEQTVEKLTTLQLEVDKMQQVLRGSSSLTTRPVWSGSVPTSAGQIAGPAASPSPPPAPVVTRVNAIKRQVAGPVMPIFNEQNEEFNANPTEVQLGESRQVSCNRKAEAVG
eukprot:symbB.v1.2.003481.t1/scaffold178.1/size285009/8